MSDTKHNGWTNYETWLVYLWITNDEVTQRRWAALAQECWDLAETDSILSREENARRSFADDMKETMAMGRCCALEGNKDGMYADLMDAALADVNYDEIAVAFVNDVDKTATEGSAG